MLRIKTFKLFFISLLIVSCATYKKQDKVSFRSSAKADQPTHTFFIAGGMGNATEEDSSTIIATLKESLENAPKNSTLIFTGDNVSEEDDAWDKDKELIQKHLSVVENFKGNTVFIPGNNEWKSYKSKKVEKVEDELKDLDRERINFYPENACPLERQEINDDLDLIIIDSKWFITNWSRLEDINKKCTNITTRRRFMEELEGYINDGQDKNIVIAMHHPVFSNGTYAGHETFKSHMKPLPVVGTITKEIMNLGAFDPDHLNSRRYNYLRILVSALAQSSDRITIVSGHEESLQYLKGGDLKQIISGSLGSKKATKLTKNQITAIGGSLSYEGIHAHGARGFARLDYYPDGSSTVKFISEEQKDTPATYTVQPKESTKKNSSNIAVTQEKFKTVPVLENSESYDKSGFYEFLWGDRYREYFGVGVTAPVVSLDTLYGGLKVTKEGGGHQSYSLRLEDEQGREYAMRSLKKNALKFLKFKLPGIAYNQDDYQDTWAEEVISDFFTTAHPYMQLVINPMAKAVGVNHSDNELFYIPKQEALQNYNDTFGDELYFVERRPSDEQLNYKGYRRTIEENSGKITDFESTTDMLEKIKSDESYTVDQENYIRARIFDMLIGDWDRHQDQWRWIEYESEDGEKEFMPIPRDRDNAFPKFDGAAMGTIKLFVPTTRMWQTFDESIKNVKWLNNSGSKLDNALLTKYGPEVWEREAKAIQAQLTPEIIDDAFKRLPLEVRNRDSEAIKSDLISRLKTLPEKAVEYASYLQGTVAIRGTEKDDIFKVTRLPEGKTRVVVQRLLSDSANEVIYDRTFNSKGTKELWLYGLGDDDVFEVSGTGKNLIKIRMIGGYGDETYAVENKKKIKVYDWEHEDIAFKNEIPSKQLSDIYKTNNYHWRYFTPNANILAPNIGFRSDDGLFLGLRNVYTKNGFNGDPFRQKHTIFANYYLAFSALEMNYEGVFANIFPKWNFEVTGYYTSDLYAKNFFGRGNNTVNDEDNLDIDFYRARLRQLKASAGLAYHTLKIRALYESYRVNENPDRLFNSDNFNPEIFDLQNYAGAEVTGYYKNDDAGDFPSKRLFIGFALGYKANLELADNKFAYTSLKVGFDHKLDRPGNLVFATTGEWKTNFAGDEFFFYHAPSLGGNNGLRGFRDERFTGRSYFYQSSDLKLRLKRYITAVSPVTVGIYGGFDYGRVWDGNDGPNIWHTSQGGGLWISSLRALTFQLGYFNSNESNLIQVGFGLSF